MRQFPSAAGFRAAIAAAPLVAGCSAALGESTFGVRYELALTADEPTARGTITVQQENRELREARLRAPRERYSSVSGDGDIQRDGDVIVWRPPASGGSLRYNVMIDNQRASSSYDARVTRRWAIFRADDVFPTAKSRFSGDAESRATLHFDLPKRWSVVAPYPERADATSFVVDDPERRLDRPVGWIAAGRLGVRRDTIGNIEIAIAGPVNQGVQRISMLALLRWTLPKLANESWLKPKHINVVSADDAMWRGGLSAPNSLFVHASRPLLSENATSTLLHEMAHVMLPVAAADDHDWIDEGVAEYVTLVALRDSGTISSDRFAATIDGFAKRGSGITSLRAKRARGDLTARAVAIFHDLDQELSQRSGGDHDVFDLLRALQDAAQPVDLESLRRAAATLIGGAPVRALMPDRAPLDGAQN